MNFLSFFQTCYEMDRYLKDEPKPKAFKTEPNDLMPWEFFTAPGPISGTWSVKVDPLFDDLLNDRNLDTLSMSSSSSTCSGKSWDSSISCSLVVKKERIDDEYDDSDSNDEKLVNCRNKNNNNNNNTNNNNIKNNNNNNSIGKNFNTRNIQIIKSGSTTSSTAATNKIELLIARTPSSSSNHHHHHQLSAGTTLSTMLMPATLSANNQHETLTPPSSPESSSTNKCSKNLTLRETAEPELAAIIDNQGIFRVSNGTTLTRNTIVRLSNSKNSFGVTKILQMSPTTTNNNANFQQTTTIASTTAPLTSSTTTVTAKGVNSNQTG